VVLSRCCGGHDRVSLSLRRGGERDRGEPTGQGRSPQCFQAASGSRTGRARRRCPYPARTGFSSSGFASASATAERSRSRGASPVFARDRVETRDVVGVHGGADDELPVSGRHCRFSGSPGVTLISYISSDLDQAADPTQFFRPKSAYTRTRMCTYTRACLCTIVVYTCARLPFSTLLRARERNGRFGPFRNSSTRRRFLGRRNELTHRPPRRFSQHRSAPSSPRRSRATSHK
jgi:hypothetical protein